MKQVVVAGAGAIGLAAALALAKDGWAVTEVPAFCRYFPEASQNPLLGSLIYGLGTLAESWRVFMYRIGLGAARAQRSA